MYEGITARGAFGRGRGGLGSFRNGAAAALAAGPAGRSVLPDLDISSWCCIALHFVTFWDISRHFIKLELTGEFGLTLSFASERRWFFFGLLRFDFRLLRLNPPIKANGNKGLMILDIRDPRRWQGEILENGRRMGCRGDWRADGGQQRIAELEDAAAGHRRRIGLAS
jgi:hypothetical protein